MDNITINIVERPQVVVINATGTQGTQGVQGVPGITGNFTMISVTENIAIGDVINGDGSKANSSIVGKRDLIIGVAAANIASGSTGQIILIGDLVNPSWAWTSGSILYLNGTVLSTIPPTTGFIQKIAIAKSSTTITIQLNNSILL